MTLKQVFLRSPSAAPSHIAHPKNGSIEVPRTAKLMKEWDGVSVLGLVETRRKHPCGPRFACFAGSHMKCRATVGRPFASAAKEAAAPADRKGGRKNAAQRDA